MQHAYRQANNTYGDAGANAAAGGSFPQIGVEIMLGARYAYAMVAAANTFTCTATGNIDDDATIDTWVVDESGVITNTINDVTA